MTEQLSMEARRRALEVARDDVAATLHVLRKRHQVIVRELSNLSKRRPRNAGVRAYVLGALRAAQHGCTEAELTAAVQTGGYALRAQYLRGMLSRLWAEGRIKQVNGRWVAVGEDAQ